MRRLLLLVLVGGLIIGFSGCDNGNSSSDDEGYTLSVTNFPVDDGTYAVAGAHNGWNVSDTDTADGDAVTITVVSGSGTASEPLTFSGEYNTDYGQTEADVFQFTIDVLDTDWDDNGGANPEYVWPWILETSGNVDNPFYAYDTNFDVYGEVATEGSGAITIDGSTNPATITVQ